MKIKIILSIAAVMASLFWHFQFSGAVVNNEDTVGSLENADCTSVSGWAYDPDTPKKAISIQILKDGSSVGEFGTADQAGGYRFNVSTPDVFKDGRNHELAVKALNNREGGGGNDTIIGSRSIQCGGSGGGAAWPPPEGTPDSTIQVFSDKFQCFDLKRQEDGRVWNNICTDSFSQTRLSGTYMIEVKPQAGATPSSINPSGWSFVSPGATLTFQVRWTGAGANRLPVGKFGADCSELFGWAYDPDTPNNSISVEIYKDGQAGGGGILIGSWPTDVFRGDVNAANDLPGGNHGFDINTPESLKDGLSHALYAYGIDTSAGPRGLLDGSPRTINCGGRNTGSITVRSYENNGQGIRADYVFTRPDGSSFRDSIAGDFTLRQQPTGSWTVRAEQKANYKYPPQVSPGNAQTLNRDQTITFSFTWESEPKPPTAAITCNGSSSTTVPYGGSANINWSSINASSCTVSPDGWIGLSGQKTVTNITSFRSYRVTCSQ